MSVDFEPVRIGGRRPRIDPLVVGAVAVVVALVVAIAKPWESNGAGGPSAPPAAIAATPRAAPAGSPPTSRQPAGLPPATPGLSAPSWAELANIVGQGDFWGVVAVVGQTSRFTTEGGAPVDYEAMAAPGSPGDEDVPAAILRPRGLTIFALGPTFPSGGAPDDVRIWQVRRDGELDWIDATPIEPPPGPDVPMLLVRPGASPATIEPWQPGQYQIDILRRGRVQQIPVTVANAFGIVPTLESRPVTESRLVSPSDSDPSAVRVGLFATVDGLGVSLGAATSRPLDEADAWTAANDPPPGGQAPVVAKVFLPRATGLGVMLTSHASVELAVMRRLAPIPLAPTPPARGGISESQGRTPYVVFAAPDGQALSPGVYAISVSWSDDAGVHAATWHVELRPGPILPAG